MLCLASALSAAESIKDEYASGMPGAGVPEDQQMSRGIVHLNEIQEAFNTSDPRANVLMVQHHKNMTHKVRLREMMNTLIVLPEGEEIENVSLGDKANFEFSSLSLANGNMGNISAKYPGADTNLILVTRSKNIYSFYLRVEAVSSKYLPDLVVYVNSEAIETQHRQRAELLAMQEEQQAKNAEESTKNSQDGEYLRSRADTNPANLNFSYRLRSGDASLMPKYIMDDGLWTYFQFDEKNLDRVRNLPAIYRVVDGIDTPVNSRIEGGTVVVETLSDKWTLRSGNSHACVMAAL